MRFLTLLAAALAALLGPASAGAQVVIQDVQAGFPAYGDKTPEGRRSYYKAGAWVPVRVTLRAGAAGFPGGQLVVETADSDDVRNRFTVKVPALPADPGGKKPVTLEGYTRPGSLGAGIRVSVVDDQGHAQVYTGDVEAEPLDFRKQVFLAAGSRPEDLPAALHALETDPQRLRIRYAAAVEQVRDLPTRWFGYNGVDLVILTTSQADFLAGLVNDRERSGALAEWVRRGGRLFVSVSPKNRQQTADLFHSWQPALPPVLNPAPVPFPVLEGEVLEFSTIEGPGLFGEVPAGQPFEAAPGQQIAIVRLRTRGPGIGPVEVLAREKDEYPLIVRVPYGLGNVTLVGLGLDEEPFTRWKGRTRFWQKVAARLVPGGTLEGSRSPGGPAAGAAANDLATDLQKELEVFPGVRPVLFGLVAFLIFVYILVVGPLDFFFLKRVVKRLQWTWVTYLVLVVGITAAALYAASARQDQPLQVNQVVLLDVDQLGPQPRVYGTTWFTLFSPQLRNYTVGLEPAPGWAEQSSPSRLTWLGRPEVSGLNSTGRQRAEVLFRAGYDYAPGGGELVGVPLPHAGTKSFQATWEANFPKGFEARLNYEPGQEVADRVFGTVKNPLPVELEDAMLSYGGKWFAFSGPLKPGRAVALKEATPIEFFEWANFRKEQERGAAGSFTVGRLMRNILFHEKLDPSGSRRDHVLRRLDQSWRTWEPRVRETPVALAVLYGRLPRVRGTLRDAGNGPARLRLAETGAGPLDGNLTRDVYVRVYLPVVEGKEE